MAEEKTKINFRSSQCEDKFNLLPAELKETILEGEETYTPRVVVLKSSCMFYPKEYLSALIQIDGFIALKRIKSYGDERTEIIFEKY